MNSLITILLILFSGAAIAAPSLKTKVIQSFKPAQQQMSCEHFSLSMKEQTFNLELLSVLKVARFSNESYDLNNFLEYMQETSAFPFYRWAQAPMLTVESEAISREYLDQFDAALIISASALELGNYEKNFLSGTYRWRHNKHSSMLQADVSTLDICQKQQLDLVLLADCEIDDFNFYQCQNTGQCLKPAVYAWKTCQTKVTLPIELKTASQVLAQRSRVIRRGTYKP